jgi:hypothetical protein
LVNRLPLHRVDELIRHFDAGMGIRATARATGHAPRTISRYRRSWLQGGSRPDSVVCRLSPRARKALAAEAAARGHAPSVLASRLLETVADESLVALILSETLV